MFNLFSKSKKKTKSPDAAKVRKKSTNTHTASKKANNKKQKDPAATMEISSRQVPVTPDQTLHQAAEKLETARSRLDSGATANDSTPPQNREDLIKYALDVHRVKSRLLDNLDEDTRLRLRTLAMEAMAVKPVQKDD